MIVWLLAHPALAAPPILPDDGEDIDIEQDGANGSGGEDWGFRGGADIDIDTEEDDAEMVDFVAAEKLKPPPANHFHLVPAGHKPLADDWPIQFLSFNDTWIVVELPVLVSLGRGAFEAEHPGGMVIIGEWTSGPHALTVRQIVTPDQVLADSPTWVFLKAALPNPAKASDVRVLVKTGELPAPPAEPEEGAKPPAKPPEPPPPPPPPKDRFARTTVVMRK